MQASSSWTPMTSTIMRYLTSQCQLSPLSTHRRCMRLTRRSLSTQPLTPPTKLTCYAPDRVPSWDLSTVLLRPEFAEAPNRKTQSSVDHILVTTGGSDAAVLSPVLASAARDVGPLIGVTVVAGPYFSAELLTVLQRVADTQPRMKIVRTPDNFRDLMLGADLAITTGGQTAYELAATATPMCAVRAAMNQTANLRGLAARGALDWVGNVGDADLRSRIARAVASLVTDAGRRQCMGRLARSAVDGCGARRVSREILGLCA